MQVTLSKALKMKNKLVGEINKLWIDIDHHNQYVEEETPNPVDVSVLFKEVTSKVEKLIMLKTSIERSNYEIVSQLKQIVELKGMLKRIQYLAVDERTDRTPTRDGDVLLKHTKVFINKKMKDDFVKQLEVRIEELQDQIDEHNHKLVTIAE